MNEINNNPNQRRNQPVARTGGYTPQSPQANRPPVTESAGNVDIFKTVYREQKIQNEQQAAAANLEKQRIADREFAAANAIPVLNPSEIKATEEKNKKFKIVFIILTIITIILFLASALYFVFGMMQNQQKDDIQGNITTIPANTESAVLTSPFNYEKTYGVTFPEGMKEEYKDLYAQNQNFAGWLTVPGTCIDTPVYYTPTSDQYYLKHNNYDNYTKYGIPYLDPSCDPVNLSRNSVIYGHNFDDDLIFDELHNYQDPEYYKKYPVIEFGNLYETYKWKIIAAFHTNGSYEGDNDYLFYYIAAEFGDNSLMKFHDELLQRSYIHTGVDVQPGDKLLTLSTCTYFFDRNGSLENARFAVIARLVRDGESEEIDESLVKANDNVRYPQLYYDVFGGKNPWINSTKWVPEAD